MLVPEVQARRVLRDHSIRLRVLAPYGAWIGCGTLRVLRCKFAPEPHREGGEVELIVGYESYRL